MNRKLGIINRVLKTAFVFVLFFTWISPPDSIATLSTGMPDDYAGFAVRFKNEVCPYKVTAIFVLPNEQITFEIDSPKESQSFLFTSEFGDWIKRDPIQWSWKAPAKTGLTTLCVTDTNSGQSMQINAFVMIPFQKASKGMINGYMIGRYPSKLKKTKGDMYQMPVGFIEVTPENKNTYLSPHFKLNQFICKQSGGFPKYLVLREKLIYKLEKIVETINEVGVSCDSLFVMSGYRTPYYNRSIRNTNGSRHQWGDAADIYIDQNRNGWMDDINGDGREDYKDIDLFSRIIDKEVDQKLLKQFVGGMGIYRSTKEHGPFVHVDARGIKARWVS